MLHFQLDQCAVGIVYQCKLKHLQACMRTDVHGSTNSKLICSLRESNMCRWTCIVHETCAVSITAQKSEWCDITALQIKFI